MSDMVTTIRAQTETASAERRTFQGKEYLVVPVVAMVEGVRFGANQSEPELGLASEFGKFPPAWNNRPLVINHPQIDGEFVSANSTEVRTLYEFGFTDNAYVEEGKLKLEAWIDLSVAETNDAVADFVAQIDAGEMIEVSVGFISDLEKTKGQFNNQAYGGIWRNILPDHLAFLTNERGACSIEDGCGVPRINQTKESTMTFVADSGAQAVQTIDCGCGCGGKGTCGTNVQTSADSETPANPKMNVHTIAANIVSRDIKQGLAQALRAYLRETGDAERYFYSDIFGFTTGSDSTVIFDAYTEGVGYTYEALRFDMAEDLSVTFNGDIFPVRIVSQIIPNQDNQENNMSNQSENATATENTDTAVEAGATQPAETPVEASTEAKANPAVEAPAVEAQSSGISNMPTTVSISDALKTLSKADQDLVNDALAVHASKRDSAIKTLMATNRCKFSEDQLKTLSMADLDNMLELAGVNQSAAPAPTEAPAPDYAGRAAANPDAFNVNAEGSAETNFVEAPKIFAKK